MPSLIELASEMEAQRELTLYDLTGNTPDLSVDEDGNVIREGWLVFYNVEVDAWWNKFLADGYQHVGFIHHDGFQWNLCNHGLLHKQSVALPVETIEEVRELMSKLTGSKHSWLKVRTTIHRKHPRRSKFIMVPDICVEDCKAQLGIRDYWCYTPKQLHDLCFKDPNIEVLETIYGGS